MDDQQTEQDGAATNEPNKDEPAFQAIRSRALTELTPVLDELTGDAEKKFEVAIAAFRVSDSTELLEKALNFAIAISDPTEKADALIDVINEANVQLAPTNT
jgi:hypothetical protein